MFSYNEIPMSDKGSNPWRPTMDGISLTWQGLSVDAGIKNQHFFSSNLTTRKNIINNVTGAVKAGTFVALMGPSGAGKSTLMGALANRNANDIYVNGDIRINGDPIGNYIRKISGFMDQQDLFADCLTVREHLYFMARMKLPRTKRKRDILNLIEDFLVQLGLVNCADSQIGGIGSDKVLSGGEKKRLSFATEMLTNPPLLFCDEPTTGLDAYSAQTLVKIMKAMASQGKTIVCTIHQPSSELFDEFHQLILLSEGRIAFMGDPPSALRFFERHDFTCPENYNPADFFIRCLAIDSESEEKSHSKLDQLCDEFSKSAVAQDIYKFVEYEMTTREKNSGWQTFYENENRVFWTTCLAQLLKRSFFQVFRDSSIQIMRIIQKLVLAVMVSLCFIGTIHPTQTGVQSIQGVIFIFITENTFGALYGIMSLFPNERPLFMREFKNGLYSPTLYYFSKIVAITPGLIIEPILFTTIVYCFTGLRHSAYAFFMTSLAVIIVMNVATACGIFFSNAFSSTSIAIACLVPFDYILMITSGVFVKLDTLPSVMAWFKYLSWFMYSNEAMTIVQWDDIHNITCASNPEIPCLHDGGEVLRKYEFKDTHLFVDIIAMVWLYVVFHVLGFAFFYWRAKGNK